MLTLCLRFLLFAHSHLKNELNISSVPSNGGTLHSKVQPLRWDCNVRDGQSQSGLPMFNHKGRSISKRGVTRGDILQYLIVTALKCPVDMGEHASMLARFSQECGGGPS